MILYLTSKNSYPLRMKSRVSVKGQVTIPKKLRDRLGIAEGTVLAFEEEDGRLVASKVGPVDPVAAVFGVISDGRRSDEVVASLRGEPADA